MKTVPIIRTFRGEVCENVHFALTVVCSKTGNILQMFPESNDNMVYLRSAAKPFQAFTLYQNPLARDIPLEEWAIIQASHAANRRQLDMVERVLERSGANQSDLQCGPHPPVDEDMARSLICSNALPTAIHNNCSGKHAGMLLACHLYGLPKESYLDPDHPLQAAILDTIKNYSETSHIAVAIDGCGAPTFSLPIKNIAQLYANFATQPEFSLLRRAMTTFPEIIGDPLRIDTEIMRITEGNLVAKVGAEGFIAVANQKRGEGLALKLLDGNSSIRDRLIIAVLEDLGWIDGQQAEDLWNQPQFSREQYNTQGKAVGYFEIRLPWIKAASLNGSSG